MGSFALANWVDEKRIKATTRGRNLGMLISGVCQGRMN